MAPPSPSRSRGKRAELSAWLNHHSPEQIGDAELEDLRRTLAPVSESYLRKLLRESGVPLTPMVGGVRQDDLNQLETTLLALLDEYEKGDVPHRTSVRKLVITAKDHARWAARHPDRRAEKEEMLLWMLTWLENPPVFREWVKLRRALLP